MADKPKSLAGEILAGADVLGIDLEPPAEPKDEACTVIRGLITEVLRLRSRVNYLETEQAQILRDAGLG